MWKTVAQLYFQIPQGIEYTRDIIKKDEQRLVTLENITWTAGK